MKIGVFCSSKNSFQYDYHSEAQVLSAEFLRRSWGLVYGGGESGLMKSFADAFLAGGGHVTGVFPKGHFPNEKAHPGVSEIIYTEDLADRKKQLMELSSAFLVFPGGLGTLDEFVEVLTWKTVRCFDKPVFLWNANGFWNSFLALMDDLESKKVLYPEAKGCFKTVSQTSELFASDIFI